VVAHNCAFYDAVGVNGQKCLTSWITNVLFPGKLKLWIIRLLASIKNYKVETETAESQAEASTNSCHLDVVELQPPCPTWNNFHFSSTSAMAQPRQRVWYNNFDCAVVSAAITYKNAKQRIRRSRKNVSASYKFIFTFSVEYLSMPVLYANDARNYLYLCKLVMCKASWSTGAALFYIFESTLHTSTLLFRNRCSLLTFRGRRFAPRSPHTSKQQPKLAKLHMRNGKFWKYDNEYRDQVVRTRASYLEGPGLKSRSEYKHPKVFRGFLSSSTQIPGQNLKFGHDRFVPCPFLLIIH
jgi:hypothetical protein